MCSSHSASWQGWSPDAHRGALLPHTLAGCFSPVFLTPSPVLWVHLPNRPLSPEILSQVRASLLGSPRKMRSICLCIYQMGTPECPPQRFTVRVQGESALKHVPAAWHSLGTKEMPAMLIISSTGQSKNLRIPQKMVG